eukprot:3718961-Heterocapsa_arctica.AAC.1
MLQTISRPFIHIPTKSIAPGSARCVDTRGEPSGEAQGPVISLPPAIVLALAITAQEVLDNYLHDKRTPIRAPVPKRLK